MMSLQVCVPVLMCLLCASICEGADIFVDKGVPYSDGPLNVGELVLAKTIQKSPLHTKVYFPLAPGDFAVIVFVGGLNGVIPTELYEIFLTKVASHGFVVVGIDTVYPGLTSDTKLNQEKVGSAIVDKIYLQINFTRQYLVNRTQAVARWDKLGLLCHSAGCASTLDLVRDQKLNISASVFLEPFSNNATKPVEEKVPAFMYGTQLSEEMLPCSIPGKDYNQYYTDWTCPRIVLEVADFGHCDILDPAGWEMCHLSHFCKTTNDTRLDEYRQFLQGAVSSFFITYLQGRPDAVSYIADQDKVPLKLLLHKTDLNC